MGAYKYLQELYKKNKAICFVFSSVSDAGNFAILRPFIEPPDPHVLIKLEDWGTAPNKGTSFTVSVCDVVDVRSRFPREQRTVNPNGKVSTRSSSNGVLDPRLKKELDGWLEHFVC